MSPPAKPGAYLTELAGVLRSLSERHPYRLQMVLCGGERLAELKYSPKPSSLLNMADVLKWPEPTTEDVLAWQQRDFPDLSLSMDEAQALLQLCGGHTGWLHFCLQQQQMPGLDIDSLRQALEEHISLSGLFIPHRENAGVKERLCKWLSQDDLGAFDYWPADTLLRQLYWSNLLTKRGERFVWRCEVLRTVGWQVLGCGE